MVSTLGFVWIVTAILVVTNASAEVWLACGIAGCSLACANALHSDRSQKNERQSATRARNLKVVAPVSSPVTGRSPFEQPQLADGDTTRLGLLRS